MGHSGTQKLEKKKIAMTSSANVDRTFRMRSLGTATPGITDQYSDGKAAKVWQLYIGGPLLTFSLFGPFSANIIIDRQL